MADVEVVMASSQASPLREGEGEEERSPPSTMSEADMASPNSSMEQERAANMSAVELLLGALKRSGLSCNNYGGKHEEEEDMKMEIGWPDNVRHVVHVTFDRFKGFLGLPLELELEIPRRVPSASASVFGVSAESMQCSYDQRGNSVPVILLLLQERLYDQGGLKAEGIFRINPENSQEEHVRDQLNKGIVPQDIDVHCLAGLIKAWLRELPSGVLDCLSPEEVMQCHTEEQSINLVKLLPPTQSALLNWAIDLMADVVQHQEFNKMNARNIAMVFAPNMTQMSDPLTALMHAVQVMNLLKNLILKELRDREEALLDPRPLSSCHRPDKDGHRDGGEEGYLRTTNSLRPKNRVTIEESQSSKASGASSFSNVEARTFLQYIGEAVVKGKETPSLFSNGSRGEGDDCSSNGLDKTRHAFRNCSGRIQGERCRASRSGEALVLVEALSESSSKMENVAFIGQESDLQEFAQVQCSLFERSSSKGQSWSANRASQIDQNNGRVEVW